MSGKPTYEQLGEYCDILEKELAAFYTLSEKIKVEGMTDAAGIVSGVVHTFNEAKDLLRLAVEEIQDLRPSSKPQTEIEAKICQYLTDHT